VRVENIFCDNFRFFFVKPKLRSLPYFDRNNYLNLCLKLLDDNEKAIDIVFEIDEEREYLLITTAEPLIPDVNYALTSTYTGYLKNNNYGFYIR